MDYKRQSYATLLGAAALMILAGCATTADTTVGNQPQPDRTRCARVCELEITFPDDRQPPSLPDQQLILEIEGGTNVDLTVPGLSSRRVLLIFEKPAFVQRSCGLFGRIPPNPTTPPPEGQYVIELKTRTCLTALDKDECKPSTDENKPGGCKYMIVELSDKMRQPLDPWIILH